MSSTGLQVRGYTVGPLESNAYLLRRPGRPAVAVDPGHPDDRLLRQIDDWGEGLAAILLTHAHLDHVAGVPALMDAHPVPLYLHPDDRPLYDAAPDQAASFGIRLPDLPDPDRALEADSVLEVADIALDVHHTPGHSPGHVIFRVEDVCFVGDCVFAGSIGRTDLPGGDAETLLRSIREHILSLPSDTTLHPGHGPRTTVGRETESNPFLSGAFGWSG